MRLCLSAGDITFAVAPCLQCSSISKFDRTGLVEHTLLFLCLRKGQIYTGRRNKSEQAINGSARRKGETTVAKSPRRYTTFAPGELEARLRELSPNGDFFCVTESEAQTVARTGSRLLKEHRFTVTLPDETKSPCRYERLGSQYHRFEYVYQDGSTLPRQNLFERLANDRSIIEAKGQELAEQCFRDAVEYERRDYFARASEPSDGSRKKQPEKYRLNAKTAKELGGYYAVCLRAPGHLFPIGRAYPLLQQANAAWCEMNKPDTVVACCNRLDRCWEVPKYNPLYAYNTLREIVAALSPERLGRKEEREDEPSGEPLSGSEP